MELNNFGFNKYKCIHCPTEKEAIEVLKIAHDKGYKWCDKTPYINELNWDTYKENTCYYLYDGDYSRVSYAVNNGYEVIEAEEFIRIHNKVDNHKPYLVW